MSNLHEPEIKITLLKNAVAIPLLVLAALFPMVVPELFPVRFGDNAFAVKHSLPFVLLAASLIFPAKFYEKAYVIGIIGAAISGCIAELALYGWLWYNLAHYKTAGVAWAVTSFYFPLWMIPVMGLGFRAGRVRGKG